MLATPENTYYVVSFIVTVTVVNTENFIQSSVPNKGVHFLASTFELLGVTW